MAPLSGVGSSSNMSSGELALVVETNKLYYLSLTLSSKTVGLVSVRASLLLSTDTQNKQTNAQQSLAFCDLVKCENNPMSIDRTDKHFTNNPRKIVKYP